MVPWLPMVPRFRYQIGLPHEGAKQITCRLNLAIWLARIAIVAHVKPQPKFKNQFWSNACQFKNDSYLLSHDKRLILALVKFSYTILLSSAIWSYKCIFGLENIAVSKFYLRKPTFRNPPMRRLQKLALNQSEIGVNNMYISVFREYINPTV